MFKGDTKYISAELKKLSKKLDEMKRHFGNWMLTCSNIFYDYVVLFMPKIFLKTTSCFEILFQNPILRISVLNLYCFKYLKETFWAFSSFDHASSRCINFTSPHVRSANTTARMFKLWQNILSTIPEIRKKE